MKAVDEVGTKKSVKFVLYALAEVAYHHIILHLLFFPPCRKFFLKILGAKIGKGTILMEVKFFNWHHTGPKGLKIGNDCFLGDEILIDLYGRVTMGDQVTLAQRVTVLTHLNVGYADHPLQKYFPKTAKPVVFESGCVIGATSTILPGVTIGRNSFVGAGSIVTHDVPSNSLYAGNPAKLIRKLK